MSKTQKTQKISKKSDGSALKFKHIMDFNALPVTDVEFNHDAGYMTVFSGKMPRYYDLNNFKQINHLDIQAIKSDKLEVSEFDKSYKLIKTSNGCYAQSLNDKNDKSPEFHSIDTAGYSDGFVTVVFDDVYHGIYDLKKRIMVTRPLIEKSSKNIIIHGKIGMYQEIHKDEDNMSLIKDLYTNDCILASAGLEVLEDLSMYVKNEEIYNFKKNEPPIYYDEGARNVKTSGNLVYVIQNDFLNMAHNDKCWMSEHIIDAQKIIKKDNNSLYILSKLLDSQINLCKFINALNKSRSIIKKITADNKRKKQKCDEGHHRYNLRRLEQFIIDMKINNTK